MTAPRFSSEGIYRRVSVRMYGDAKFAKLSPLPPSGQALWLYLLTGPHTGPIPGVFVVGRAAMAEALGWDLADFDKAVAEIVEQGMVEVDAKTRLWFVPQAIKHNPPASPNVVRSWRSQWAVLPECALRERIAEALDQALGEPYAMAFVEVSGNPSSKASAKALQEASPKALSNQEQEQEQQQEQEEVSEEAIASSSSARPTASGARPTIPCPYDAIVDAYHQALPMLPSVRIRDGKTWTKRQKAMRELWGWVLSSRRSDGEKRATTGDEALAWIRQFFERAADNDFIMGRTPRGAGHENWTASFDYLLTEKGKQQVIEKTRTAA